MSSKKIWDNLKPGNDYADRRNLHGNPPSDYTWNNSTNTVADQYGTPQHPDTELTDHGYRDRRLIWLAQFDLVVKTKGKYRYWYWLAEAVAEDDPVPKYLDPNVDWAWRRIAWWERRKTTDPIPAEPGLWPLSE